MKKLYIMFTFILSSFFLFNYNVKAYVINYTIDSSFIDTFKSEKYINLRNDVINYSKEHDCYYFIRRYMGSNYIFFINEQGNIYFVPDSNYIIAPANPIFYFDSYNYNLSNSSKGSGSMFIGFSGPSNDYFVDTNYPNFYLDNLDGMIINFGSCSYSLNNGDRVRGFYDYVMASENDCILPSDIEEDTHKEEKEVLSNFYSLIFEKIDLLANSILSNYIYLTIIVIFILIFLIELIRRYLL